MVFSFLALTFSLTITGQVKRYEQCAVVKTVKFVLLLKPLTIFKLLA